MGSDGVGYRVRTAGVDFNPRSPHGERLYRLHKALLHKYFNPRSPHGERHILQDIVDVSQISIHAPHMGSDRRVAPVMAIVQNFNPRSPHGERPVGDISHVGVLGISIHAPRMGSDAYNGLIIGMIN